MTHYCSVTDMRTATGGDKEVFGEEDVVDMRKLILPRSQTSVSMLMALMLLLWRGLQFCFRAS